MAVGYFAWEIFSISRPTLTEIPDENSRIYIEQHYRRKERAEITDPVDVAFLRRLFERQYEAVFDNPICPFDIIKISFVHGWRTISFSPAADDCELIRYGNTEKIIDVTPGEHAQLKKLAQKYRQQE